MSTEFGNKNTLIGERLKEERDRLGLTQDALGTILGVDRKVVRNYEGNKTSPRADQLLMFKSEGADLMYILTGSREVVLGQGDSPAEVLAERLRAMSLTEEDAAALLYIANRLTQENICAV